MSRTFKTTLDWKDDEGNTLSEVEAIVTYKFYGGFAGDRIDPPEPESVEITEIEAGGADVDKFYDDAGLLDECMRDWWDAEERAADQRAEAMADLRRELMG